MMIFPPETAHARPIMLSSVSATAQGAIRKHASPTPALHLVNCGASESIVPFTMLADNSELPRPQGGASKNLNEGVCIHLAPAPHSSPSTGRGILRRIS